MGTLHLYLVLDMSSPSILFNKTINKINRFIYGPWDPGVEIQNVAGRTPRFDRQRAAG